MRKRRSLQAIPFGIATWCTVIGILGLSCGCRKESDLCNELAWPYLVGKWELAPPASQPAGEDLVVFLYPAGEAIKNGQRGTWRVVACEGTTAIVDLPRRAQTDACELRLDELHRIPPERLFDDMDRVPGELTCGATTVSVRRTQSRGLVPAGLEAAAADERSKRQSYEQAQREQKSRLLRAHYWLTHD